MFCIPLPCVLYTRAWLAVVRKHPFNPCLSFCSPGGVPAPGPGGDAKHHVQRGYDPTFGHISCYYTVVSHTNSVKY